MLERTFLGAGSAIKKLLSGGHLIGSTILPVDVERARDIWGVNSDNEMANPYRADHVPKVAKEARTVPRGQIDQIGYVDLLFLFNKIMCTVTTLPLGMSWSFEVTGKSEPEMSKSLQNFVSNVKSSGHTTEIVRADG